MRSVEEIENWLIWNGAWRSFMRNADASGAGYARALRNGEDVITKAFRWEQTPEGAGYWEDVHHRYVAWYWYNAEHGMNEHE